MLDKYLNFRAWDIVRNEYLSAGEVIIAIQSGMRPKSYKQYLDILTCEDKYRDRFIIEQFIGYKDCNNKSIFEGDYIKFTFDNNIFELPVVWSKINCQFLLYDCNSGTSYEFKNCLTLEIVGNINVKIKP